MNTLQLKCKFFTSAQFESVRPSSTRKNQIQKPRYIMSRNGKIARLPGQNREEINRRLHDGEDGKKILGWLNYL